MSELAWSPDGEWLLYTMSFDGDRDIFRVRADGSSHQRLTGAPFSEELPRYAPFAGRAWNPLWMILAAVGMIVASLAWRFRP